MRITRITTYGILCLILSLNFASAQKPVYLDVNQSIEKRVEHALSLMILEDKVAMCHAPSKFSSKGIPCLGISEVCSIDGQYVISKQTFLNQWNVAGWISDSCTALSELTCIADSFNPKMALYYGKAIGEDPTI